MRSTEPERKQAYEALMQVFNNFEESARINGTKYSQEDYDRYIKVATLCIYLFKGEPTNARITIDEVTKDKPFVGVTVYMDEFELSTVKKADFIELITLADNVIFYGDEKNVFHMSFYVNGIWAEQATE